MIFEHPSQSRFNVGGIGIASRIVAGFQNDDPRAWAVRETIVYDQRTDIRSMSDQVGGVGIDGELFRSSGFAPGTG